jgi:hypothetical protein
MACVVPNRKKNALQSYSGLAGDYAHEVIDHAVSYAEGNVHTNELEKFAWSGKSVGYRHVFRVVYGTPVRASEYDNAESKGRRPFSFRSQFSFRARLSHSATAEQAERKRPVSCGCDRFQLDRYAAKSAISTADPRSPLP